MTALLSHYKTSCSSTQAANMATANRRELFRFRTSVFSARLKWDVKVDNTGQEMDEYDQLNPIYVNSKDAQDNINGCLRLLPCSGFYMLRDTFPQLLQGEAAPTTDKVWEISRFGVDTSDRNHNSQGISKITFDLLLQAGELAVKGGATQFVFVTTASIERYLRKMNVKTARFGLGKSVDLGGSRSVALKIELNEEYFANLRKQLEL